MDRSDMDPLLLTIPQSNSSSVIHTPSLKDIFVVERTDLCLQASNSNRAQLMERPPVHTSDGVIPINVRSSRTYISSYIYVYICVYIYIYIYDIMYIYIYRLSNVDV